MSELKKCEHCGGAVTLEVIDGRACIDDPTCERRHWEADVPCRYQGVDGLVEWWNTRSERTCEPVKKFSEESPWPRLVCSECGRELHWDDIVNEVGEDSCELQPYCGCGARVVKP